MGKLKGKFLAMIAGQKPKPANVISKLKNIAAQRSPIQQNSIPEQPSKKEKK